MAERPKINEELNTSNLEVCLNPKIEQTIHSRIKYKMKSPRPKKRYLTSLDDY